MNQNQSPKEMTSQREDYLPVSDALQVIYCPRNFYYRFVAGVTDQNARMERGALEDSARNERRVVYRTGSIHTRNLALTSDRLGLAGNVDAIEETSEGPIPLEYKTGDKTENLYDRAQLCAYAMIIEEMRNIVIPKGYLYYTGARSRVEVPFNDELRQTVIRAVEQAWDILEGNEIPPPLDDPRCRGCALAETCMPDQVTHLREGSDRCPSRVAPRCTFERTVFVDETWGALGKEEGRLIVKQAKSILAEIPFETFDQVFLLGNVSMSGAVLQEFFRRNVFVAFFSSFGRFEGCLSPEKSRYAALRIAQWSHSTDESRRLIVAREIVSAKIANMRVMVQRASRKSKEDGGKHAAQMNAIRKDIDACNDANVLLGIEGIGSRLYFEVFRGQFDEKWGFGCRTRRPPKDPVNAVMSFGYSILTGQITGMIQAVGLDPYVGYLHREHYGKPCLALDLIEVFRPIVVDSIVLRMFSTGMVSEGDFEKVERGGIYLGEKGRDAFFRAYSQRMDETVTHPVFGVTLSYRRIIEMEIRFLAKYLVGEIPEFRSFRVR